MVANNNNKGMARFMRTMPLLHPGPESGIEPLTFALQERCSTS